MTDQNVEETDQKVADVEKGRTKLNWWEGKADLFIALGLMAVTPWLLMVIYIPEQTYPFSRWNMAEAVQTSFENRYADHTVKVYRQGEGKSKRMAVTFPVSYRSLKSNRSIEVKPSYAGCVYQETGEVETIIEFTTRDIITRYPVRATRHLNGWLDDEVALKMCQHLAIKANPAFLHALKDGYFKTKPQVFKLN